MEKTLKNRNNKGYPYERFAREVHRKGLLNNEKSKHRLADMMIKAYPEALDKFPTSTYTLAWLSNAISTLNPKFINDVLEMVAEKGHKIIHVKTAEKVTALNPFLLWPYPYNCSKSEKFIKDEMPTKPGLTITSNDSKIPLLYFKTGGVNVGISLRWAIINGNMILVPGVWYFPYYVEDNKASGFESLDHFGWSLTVSKEQVFLHPSIYWRKAKGSSYSSHYESFLAFREKFSPF